METYSVICTRVGDSMEESQAKTSCETSTKADSDQEFNLSRPKMTNPSQSPGSAF